MAAPQIPLSLSTPLIPLLSHPALRSTSLGPNHLPNLAALLRPFTSSFATAGASSSSLAASGLLAARSLNLQTVALPGWGLRIVDFDEWVASGQATPGEEEVADALGSALGRLAEGDGQSDRPTLANSGDGLAWRTMAGLMDVTRPEVSWETFSHPLASAYPRYPCSRLQTAETLGQDADSLVHDRSDHRHPLDAPRAARRALAAVCPVARKGALRSPAVAI